MIILKKGGCSREKGGEEETKSMPHAPVVEGPVKTCRFTFSSAMETFTLYFFYFIL
jgi:hypothetical protein